MKRYFVVILLALLALLVSPGPASASVMPATTGLEPTACVVDVPAPYVEGQDVFCYTLTVPAEYANPTGRTIRLAVMVIKALAAGQSLSETDVLPAPQPDPVFFAQGGPGGSTIDLYTSYLFNNHRLTPNRDFVLLEQRGTLYSQPVLYCEEYDQFVLDNLNVVLSDEEAERLSREAMLACRDRLSKEGVVFSDFDSFENARDIESLRLALGYDKINLYGVSYGTLLAQHYMRLYPESLRSVILDGVVPPEQNLYLESLRNEDRAFRYLFDSCRADAECNANFPNLEDVFYATVKALDEKPVSVQLYDLDNDTWHDAVLDGASLYSGVFQMLYNSTLSRLLPRIIYDASQGNFEILSKVLSLLIFDRTMSYGMYYSVMCAEDGDFDPASIDTSGIRPEIVEFNEGGAESVLSLCRAWNVSPLPSEANQPVRSDIPVLLLSGGFDPVTPAANADLVARNFSRHYNVTFPWGAHGQLFDNACSDSIVQAFWDNPLSEPDTSCLADYQTPDFFKPRDILLLPVAFKIVRLDSTLLPGFLVFLLGFLGLLSAWFFLPLAWLINLFRAPVPDAPQPGCVLRLATPFALLNGLVLAAFGGAFIWAIFSTIMGDLQLLLFFGLPGEYRLLFALPLLSLFLTLGMLAFAVQGWFSESWHILRKIYYTLIALSAGMALLILGLAGLLFGILA